MTDVASYEKKSCRYFRGRELFRPPT